MKTGKVDEVKAAIEMRLQHDPDWAPSLDLQHAIQQIRTDERPLWSLLNAGETAALKQRIEQIQQEFPDWKPSTELQQAMLNPQSNENQIWDLIHQADYARAEKAIVEQKKQNPSWQPSADMQTAMFDGMIDVKLQQYSKQHHWKGIIKLHDAYPQAFDCSHNYRRMIYADGLVRSGHEELASGTYESSLWECKEYIRLDTIEHALDRLPADHLAPLFKSLSTRKESKAAKPRMAMARYRFIMKKGVEKEDAATLIQDEPYLLATKDVNVIDSLAWDYLKAGEHAHALDIFKLARQMHDTDNLLKGEILALERLNNMHELKLLIQQHHDRLKAAGMLQEILPLLAKACSVEMDDYCKVDVLTELETYRPLTASESEEMAWSLYNTDHYSEATDRFMNLYTSEATDMMAKGVYVSAHKTGQMSKATVLAEKYGGPLVPLLEGKIAEQMIQRLQFHAAQQRMGDHQDMLEEDDVRMLENIDSSWVRGGYRMSTHRMPMIDPIMLKMHRQHYVLKGADYLDDDKSVKLTAEVERVYLDAGPAIIPPGELIGTPPIVPGPLVFPVFDKAKGYEWQIGYQKEGWKSHYFHIGQGFVGGPVPAKIKADAGIKLQLEQGFVETKAYIKPVRDFMLTYAGMQDPFTGQRWGKTMRHGLSVGGYRNLPWLMTSGNDDSWGLSYEAKLEFLKGKGVRYNSHGSLDLTLPYSFKYREAHISIGPNMRWERYRANHQHYTMGYGGYFSPQHWLAWGLNGQIVSTEGKNRSYRVFASSGYQVVTIDPSQVLPLDPDGRIFPGGKNRERTDTIEVQWLQRITPHLHVQAGLKSARSSISQMGVFSAFTTYEGQIFATWYFDERPATFSSDMEPF